ncbi:E3 ubiquitin-protein ligase RHA2B-like [Wolffia australiana]
MGLGRSLQDVSGDSISMMVLVAAASSVFSLRKTFSTALRSFIDAFLNARQLLLHLLSINIPLAEQCSVCLDAVNTGPRVQQLPCCRHIFHSLCLEEWFRQCKPSCPLCRSPLLNLMSHH